METKNETESEKLFHQFKSYPHHYRIYILNICYQLHIETTYMFNVKDNIIAISLVSTTFIKANQSNCTYIHHHLSKQFKYMYTKLYLVDFLIN